MENFSVLKIVVNTSQNLVFSASEESNHIIYYTLNSVINTLVQYTVCAYFMVVITAYTRLPKWKDLCSLR